MKINEIKEAKMTTFSDIQFFSKVYVGFEGIEESWDFPQVLCFLIQSDALSKTEYAKNK